MQSLEEQDSVNLVGELQAEGSQCSILTHLVIISVDKVIYISRFGQI